ncbi:hypothetical protein [Flagellimonas beolgyonensis]|uniref:hypothetical protein n=1 Tax=Flagellimonas beolgyonensis TaxID=864064 RepID=UPI003D64C21F
MMKKNPQVHCFLLLLFCYVPLIGQNLAVTNKIKPAFEDYFGQPRVSLFLHLNKSAYVKGEHIWFKAYLFNRVKGIPLQESVNVYVGLYDATGKQLVKHLFLSQEGYAQGQIKIDSTMGHGQHYIKATTSWMRNFDENDAYVQQFVVLDENVPPSPVSDKWDVDIQFLPEGGHWVNNVQGVLGIKAIDDKGKSLANLGGVIRNQKGAAIANFKTNRFGLSKVTMTPRQGENYTAFVDIGPEEQKKIPLPLAEKLGLALAIQRIQNNRVMLLVGTNAETKKQIEGKPLSIIIHRDGLLKSLDVVFPEDELYVSHILDTDQLHPVMNIVTLLDNLGNPIAERLFFNDRGFQKTRLNASVGRIAEDSILIRVSGFGKNQISHASVSVLPKETKAYNHNDNILSTHLLKPYLSGFVENAHYYFEASDQERMADLDLLLLTQGWSKYNWDNIFNKPPAKIFDPRVGIDVFGSINSKVPKSTDLLVYAGPNTEPTVVYLNEESTEFRLKNMVLETGDELRMTLLEKRGDLSRPNLFVRTDTGESEDKVFDLEPFNIVESLARAGGIEYNDLENFIFPDNTIKLSEVVVSEKPKIKESTTPYVQEFKLKTVTPETEGLYPRLLDLIRSNGFNVWEMPNTGYDRIRISTKRPSAFGSMAQPAPILYVDDVRYSDFNILLDFPTTRIERYYIDHSGIMEAGGGGGVIRVYTRKDGEVGAPSLRKTKPKSTFFTHLVKKGFTPIKQYYTPSYRSMSDESFRQFGTIHWVPEMKINENGVGTLSIPNTGLTEIMLCLEGMDTNGILYSEKKVVMVSTNP